jgi:glutamyl-Q tRNA(Asp) synthetase
MSRSVFRFAPSPNGALHLGHALSALTGFEMAQRYGGRFLVRIEDIDTNRARPEFVQGIFDDLAWLGLTWEEPVLLQSKHFSDYLAAAEKLRALGVLYPCFATRNEIVAAADINRLDPEGALVYPGLWRGRAAVDVASACAQGTAFALRIDMTRAIEIVSQKLGGAALTFTEFDEAGVERKVIADPARWGDVLVIRKEIPASYFLAVVIDDARQGITHVTRGMDLFAATDAQRLLQILLDLPEPVYHHHRLILDGAGRKLSKSRGDTSLAHLRSMGASPADIRRLLGFGG